MQAVPVVAVRIDEVEVEAGVGRDREWGQVEASTAAGRWGGGLGRGEEGKENDDEGERRQGQETTERR